MEHDEIGKARPRDTEPIAAMLASAFVDEPALQWMVPDPADQNRSFPGFFRAMVRGTRAHGLVMTRGDHAAAALWRLPGRTEPGTLEMLRAAPSMLAFSRHAGPRSLLLGEAARAHRPDFPFRYLQSIGVAEERQGEGLGGAILRSGLAAASAAGEPVYLETARLSNVSFFIHHGFEILDEWDVEPDGPRFTSMLRRP